MTTEEIIEYVNKIDVFEKFKIYMDYVITMLKLKHDFDIIDLERYSLKGNLLSGKGLSPYHGYSNPDKKFKGIAFYYLCKNITIKSFEEFCDESNIKIIDTGIEDCKEQGFASKSWVNFDTCSIYHFITFSNIN